MTRDLERAWLGNWRERHLGKECVNGSFKIDKGCEGTCVPCECSSIGDSSWKGFSSQGDRMTRSVDSWPLSPAIPVIPQWTREQSSHGGRAEGHGWA